MATNYGDLFCQRTISVAINSTIQIWLFVSRSVSTATVQIRHFILRTPSEIWTLGLDSKTRCIISFVTFNSFIIPVYHIKSAQIIVR